jgi:hypothetical protein
VALAIRTGALRAIAFIQHEAYDETPMPLRAAEKNTHKRTKSRRAEHEAEEDRRFRTTGTHKLLQVDQSASILVENVATGRLVVLVIPVIVTPVLVLESTGAECLHEAMQGRLRISALLQGLRDLFPVVMDFSCCDSASSNLRYEAYMAGQSHRGAGLSSNTSEYVGNVCNFKRELQRLGTNAGACKFMCEVRGIRFVLVCVACTFMPMDNQILNFIVMHRLADRVLHKLSFV